MNQWTQQQRVAMRGFTTCLLAVLLLGWFLLLSGCTKHIDPPLFIYPDTTLRGLSAQLHSVDVNGRIFVAANTHSMEPLILGGDWLVMAHSPFANLEQGKVIVYQAEWQKDGPPVSHRIVGKDSYGLIMAGDNNPRSEPSSRVTEDNYLGEIVGIYRVKP